MSGYTAFAKYYDALMDDVDYARKAESLWSLAKQFEVPGNIVLDLACGTGSLSLELAKRGLDVIGVDFSPEMLSFAAEKAARAQKEILFLCQDMTELDLYGTVDLTVCALDSLNHLPDAQSVQKTFEKVFLFTAPGGIFLFDMNTPYKHEYILGDQCFVQENEELFLVWQNAFFPESFTVQMQLDFFLKQKNGYIREQEFITEKAYSQEEIKRWLQGAGFAVLDVFGEDLGSPKNEEERWLFAAKKQRSR